MEATTRGEIPRGLFLSNPAARDLRAKFCLAPGAAESLDSHLKRGKAQWQLGTDLLAWWPAGAHLNEMFGPRYAVIGAAVGVSDANGIGQPEAGTLEARLTSVPGPARFIPTHKGQGLPTTEIAAFPTRSGSMKNLIYFPLTPQSLTDFEWLAVLDSTAYDRGGPPLQR